MQAEKLLAVRRKGYVLVGVLLILLAVTGVAHSLLVMTRSEFFASRARWDRLTRRLAAEMGLKVASRTLTGTDSLSWGEWVPSGSAAVPPRARYETRVVRLSREVFLILAEGSLETEPGRDRQVGIFWAMDPVARYADAWAILESGRLAQVDAGGAVDPTRLRDTPAPWPETSCSRFSPDLDTLFHSGLPRQGELHEDPRAGIRETMGSGGREPLLPSLGLLGHDALIKGSDLHVSGSVSPGPVQRLGRCATSSPSNWGAPLDAAHPCAEYKPVVTSEGSLVVNGGRGQGILLITGDATFRSAAHFYGLVLVAGDLEMTGESVIEGLVRVRGSVFLGARSRIVGSACAAMSALDAAERLRELVPIPQSAWPDTH